MKNSSASFVFLRGIVTGREITKKRLLKAISMNPNGLIHRTSPKTSPTEGFPKESSLAKRSPLKDNTKKETIKKAIILFIHILLCRVIFVLKLGITISNHNQSDKPFYGTTWEHEELLKRLYSHLGEKSIQHFKTHSLRVWSTASLNIFYGFLTNS